MLAVREEHRGKGIATKLVRMAIDMMVEREADEVGASPRDLFVVLLDAKRRPDRTRDRSHQHCCHEALRAAGIPEK